MKAMMINNIIISLPDDAKGGVFVTEEEYEGLKAGTHRFNDDLTAVVPKTQSEIYEEELARIKQRQTDEKNKLRSRRTAECFSIVNRGQLWYNRLTEEQITELNVWYQSWLDVTDTMVVPNKPEWLK